MLAAYDEIVDGSAARFVKMAEDGTEQRRKLESEVVRTDLRLAVRGQAFAFVIAMSGLVGGIVLQHLGSPYQELRLPFVL